MRKYMTGFVLVALVAGQGCQCCGSRSCPPSGASAYGPVESFFARPVFHPFAPRATVAVPPPGAVVVPPNGLPQGAPVVTPEAPVPGIPAPDIRNYTPPTDPNPPAWRPSPDSSGRIVPEPDPRRGKAGSDERSTTPAMPVGIPQFAEIKKNVASGLRPTHLEGLQWLKDNGYRTALYIKAPGDSDDADRKQFEEKCGMKYASLTVSPDTLSLELVDQFNAMIDPANRPLFIYDKDGSLAGALWYLHFRMVDQQSDENARAAAARIGLKEEHKDLWVAIQKILSGKR